MSLAAVASRPASAVIGLIGLGLALPLVVVGTTGSSAWFLTLLIAKGYILGIFVLGYSLMLGTTKLLSLGHACLYGGAAYSTGVLVTRFTWPFWSSALVGVLAATLLGIVFGLLASRTRGMYFAMVTLCISTAIEVFITAPELIQTTGASDGLRSIPVPTVLDPDVNVLVVCLIVLAVLATCAGVVGWFMRSALGRSAFAIGQNEERATTLGYNVAFVKACVCGLSGFLAGVAGVLSIGLNNGVAPEALNIALTALALVLTIVGGVGRVVGPIVAAVILVFIQYWVVGVLGDLWTLGYCTFAVLVLLLMPNGLGQSVRNLLARLRPGPGTGIASTSDAEASATLPNRGSDPDFVSTTKVSD